MGNHHCEKIFQGRILSTLIADPRNRVCHLKKKKNIVYNISILKIERRCSFTHEIKNIKEVFVTQFRVIIPSLKSVLICKLLVMG